MDGRRRVLSGKSGRADAKVLFVAEAPGRHGADRTGVPLHGDPTGNNFERLLAGVGWSRADVFVTNAVLCNPRDGQGRNRPPTARELSFCSHHLANQVSLVDPLVVATLGGQALESLNGISPHGLTLSRSVGVPYPWYGRTLFPLYHPSPRALLHRSLVTQGADFRELRDLVEWLLQEV